MKKIHPCRKIKLSEKEIQLIKTLKENQEVWSFDQVVRFLAEDKTLIKKRLIRMHKEKILFYSDSKKIVKTAS